jgi:hypothetical protein
MVFLNSIKNLAFSHRKHSIFITNTRQLVLLRYLTTLCSENHSKPVNAVCGQYANILTKAGGAAINHSNHTALKLEWKI